MGSGCFRDKFVVFKDAIYEMKEFEVETRLTVLVSSRGKDWCVEVHKDYPHGAGRSFERNAFLPWPCTWVAMNEQRLIAYTSASICKRKIRSSVSFRIPSFVFLCPFQESAQNIDSTNMLRLFLRGKNWVLRDQQTQYFETVSSRGKELRGDVWKYLQNIVMGLYAVFEQKLAFPDRVLTSTPIPLEKILARLK